MCGGQDRHLSLGAQSFGVKSGRRVERQMQQGHIGLAVTQQLLWLGIADQQVDGDGARFSGLGVQ